MILILLLLLYYVGMPLAAIFLSATDDRGQIDRNEVIDHRSQWMERVGIALAGAAMVCYALITRFDQSPWVIGPVVLTAWPLFSLPFRVSLNLRRKRDWWYMGDILGKRTDEDSWYDNLFHGLAAGVSNSGNALGDGRPYYPKRLPATLASLFELILFAFCCWWMMSIIG